MITQVNMAWMAGVFDQKGTLLRKNNAQRATPQLVIQIEVKDELIARRFAELTGITAEPYHTKGNFNKRPCKEHCPEPHVHHEELPWQMPPITRWAITGVGAGIVLHNLAPYLAQMDGELETFKDESLEQATFAGRGSWRTRETIKRLAHLGWNLPSSVLDNVLDSDVPGGRAKATPLSCGHQRLFPREVLAGSRIWCQLCNRYRVVAGPMRKRGKR